MLQGEKLTRYSRMDIAPFPNALKTLSDREIARRTCLDTESVSRARKGKAIRPYTQAKLARFAKLN